MRVATLLMLACCTGLAGQQVLWEQVGVSRQARFGGGGEAIGDIDGDGYKDVVVIVPIWAGTVQGIEVWCLSGRDGRVLRRRVSEAFGYNFLTATACGDMDGDGVGDYAAAQWDQGCCNRPTIVDVRSGADDSLIWRVTHTWASLLGSSLLGNLDVDGDGRPDLVATAPGETPQGVVYVYTNRGSLLYRLASQPPLLMGGRSGAQTLARIGDIDRDGADDFVVGGGHSALQKGAAYVLSGRTGRVLVMGLDQQPGDNLGDSVDGCGDMDLDGVPDFVVSGSSSLRAVVTVFSGATGIAIHHWSSDRLPWLSGFALRSGIDVDQDGVPDVLAGGAGSLHILSGRDGSVMLFLNNTLDGVGASVTVLGAQPGSRFPVFLVGSPDYMRDPFNNPLQSLGKITAFRGSPAGVEAFGLACRGHLATTPRIGARDLGTAGIRVSVHGAGRGAGAVLVVGQSRSTWHGLSLPYPMDVLGLPGCALYTSTEIALPAMTGSAGLGAGYAALDLPTPLAANGPHLLYGQWLSLDPASPRVTAFSDALHWQVH